MLVELLRLYGERRFFHSSFSSSAHGVDCIIGEQEVGVDDKRAAAECQPELFR